MIYVLRLPLALLAGGLILVIGAVLLGVCALETVWITLTNDRESVQR